MTVSPQCWFPEEVQAVQVCSQDVPWRKCVVSPYVSCKLFELKKIVKRKDFAHLAHAIGFFIFIFIFMLQDHWIQPMRTLSEPWKFMLTPLFTCCSRQGRCNNEGRGLFQRRLPLWFFVRSCDYGVSILCASNFVIIQDIGKIVWLLHISKLVSWGKKQRLTKER